MMNPEGNNQNEEENKCKRYLELRVNKIVWKIEIGGKVGSKNVYMYVYTQTS